MRLIVGLGNPGIEYQWTPHNLGFLAVDELASRWGIRVERPEAKALTGRGTFGGEEIVLGKPQTMMNLSGFSVRDLLAKYQVEAKELVLLYDDVALPWGTIRIRERGSAGGHNGVKSVIGTLGTDEFCRVRLGVQPDHAVGDLAEYVLRPMKKAALEEAAGEIGEAGDAVERILREGVAAAMNQYNRRNPQPGEEPA